MKNISKLAPLILLLLIYSAVSMADRPVVLTRDTKTAVNLMGADLVKKKDLLDCQLRLEGKPPHYKLVYSLGEIPVPTLAVKKMYDETMALIAVKAQIGGLPVSNLLLFIVAEGEPYRVASQNYEHHYSMTVEASELQVVKVLRGHYGKERLLDHTQYPNGIGIRAVLLRSHPDLFLPSMNGLGGSSDKRKTEMYYVCRVDK